MNITLIFVVLLIIMMAVRGSRRGMTKEIVGLISLAVTLFVISLIIMLYTSFKADETKNVIFTVIILLAVAFIYSIVKIFLRSAKLLSKLPVIKLLDRLLGIFVGAVEGLMIVWLIYILNEASLFGELSEIIQNDTAASHILTKIYEYNYLIRIAAGF